MSEAKIASALKQWRESLVSLTATNRLLNYRPTKSSTLEFSEHSTNEVLQLLLSNRATFTMGTRRVLKEIDHEGIDEDDDPDDLEQEVLNHIVSINFESYPGHLFTDLTQRDTDRVLRNLAGKSKREYLDKGLRTLYVALGELRWLEDSGDVRRSPLILLPAALDSNGPRESMFLSLSDDDLAVNPALALRVSDEFGIMLPTAEQVIAAIESEGMEGVFALFREISWPDGWEVREFAALSTFMFAKEAMFRDLLDNERMISGSELIKALSGATSPEESPFIFEPLGDTEIDEAAPPELNPLVLDADSSQRAAIQAAVDGRSFVLDGPPGTGKSQTIANIIGSLIASGKTVLFVSEKAVALDVVRNRLASRGLESFLFELHSSKSTRREVSDRLGKALVNTPVPPPGMSPVKLSQLKEARVSLSEYSLASNQLRLPIESNFHHIVGLHESIRSNRVGPDFEGSAANISAVQLASIEGGITQLAPHWDLYLQGSQAVWFGLEREGQLQYLLQQFSLKIESLRRVLSVTQEVRVAFELESLDDLHRVSKLIDAWLREPEFHENSWLDSANLQAIRASESELTSAEAKMAAAKGLAERELGLSWSEVPTIQQDSLSEVEEALRSVHGFSGSMPAAEVLSRVGSLTKGRQWLTIVNSQSATLATQLGAQLPRTIDEVRTLVVSAQACLSETYPEIDWLFDTHSLTRAREALAQTRSWQNSLDDAEREARSSFNERILDVDLDELELWASSTSGLTGRFTADHKAMRQVLANTSQLRWQDALPQLPKAREWSKAWKGYEAWIPASERFLGPRFKPDRTTDWGVVAASVENAEIAARARFNSREQTERVFTDMATRVNIGDLIESVQNALREWAVAEAGWTGQTETFAGSLDEHEARLAGRLVQMAPLIGLIENYQVLINLETPTERFWFAAQARLGFDSAQATYLEADEHLRQLKAIMGSSEFDRSTLKRKLAWIDEIHAILGRSASDQVHLLGSQIDVLKRSRPAVGITTDIDEYESLKEKLISLFAADRREDLAADLRDFDSASELIATFRESSEDIDNWFDFRRSVARIEELGLGAAARFARSEFLSAEEMSDFLLSTVYRAWIDYQLEIDPRLSGNNSSQKDELVRSFRQLDAELADDAVSKIIAAGVARRPKAALGQAAVIRREAEKKRKHIPVRELIERAQDVVLALHPCFMMSPLAVSQYLPVKTMFDVVIFDEASQVLPADAINCAYRGRSLIAAGDQKQLPPTSFFQKGTDAFDEDGEEDVAGDFESLLDLMKSTGAFTSHSLKWHYRSRHEDLISYSNVSFYDSRLVTYPGALNESDDAGVRYFKVPGVYRRAAGADNPIEAKHVAERVLHHFTSRPGKTLGVVAFSSKQREAIENAIELARIERPDLDGCFEDDRLQGFFVKSLEEVQGDERDVVIFSIGYGPDEHGRVYKQFGPVGRAGGERRLNVAITRAKELVEVVASMGSAEIGEVAGEGARHLRRYLDFAERGTAALDLELGSAGLGTESPFEDAVLSFVRGLGFEVQPQVGAAGYRIDLGVKHPNQPGSFMLGIECDGAMYHSSRAARDRDRLRHELLEGLGWRLHHIWGTAWYRHPEREKERLRKVLEEYSASPIAGRIGGTIREKSTQQVIEFTESELVNNVPSWTEDYVFAEPDFITADPADPAITWVFAEFVNEVAAVESPILFDVLAHRLRERSIYGRIGARLRGQLLEAVARSNATMIDGVVRHPNAGPLRVRRGSYFQQRSIDQIPQDELILAISNATADAVGITRVELISRVALAFGWKRVGAEIRLGVEKAIDALIESGSLEEHGGSVGIVSTVVPD